MIIITENHVQVDDPIELESFIFMVIMAYEKVTGKRTDLEIPEEEMTQYREHVKKIMDELFKLIH